MLTSNIYSNPRNATQAYDISASSTRNAELTRRAFQPAPLTPREQSDINRQVLAAISHLRDIEGPRVEIAQRHLQAAGRHINRLLKGLRKRKPASVKGSDAAR